MAGKPTVILLLLTTLLLLSVFMEEVLSMDVNTEGRGRSTEAHSRQTNHGNNAANQQIKSRVPSGLDVDYFGR